MFCAVVLVVRNLHKPAEYAQRLSLYGPSLQHPYTVSRRADRD